MTFDDFLVDVNKYRKFGLQMSFFVMPLMLHPFPNQVHVGSISGFMKYIKWQSETFSNPVKEDAHEMIKEINRRLIDNITEAYELGLLK